MLGMKECDCCINITNIMDRCNMLIIKKILFEGILDIQVWNEGL